MAFTAGIAPISDPRYALVVLINDPKAGEYYGGAVSALYSLTLWAMRYVQMLFRKMLKQLKTQQRKVQNVLFILANTRIKSELRKNYEKLTALFNLPELKNDIELHNMVLDSRKVKAGDLLWR